MDNRYELSMEEYDRLLVSNNALKFGTRNIVLDNDVIPRARRARRKRHAVPGTEIKEFHRQYDRVA